MAAVSNLPATVTVDTETLIEVAARLFAFHDELTEFVGGQDTPAGDHFTDLATSLLRGTVPTGDPYDDNWYRDPIVVAAHALGHEYAGNLAWRDGVLEAGICPRSADRRRED